MWQVLAAEVAALSQSISSGIFDDTAGTHPLTFVEESVAHVGMLGAPSASTHARATPIGISIFRIWYRAGGELLLFRRVRKLTAIAAPLSTQVFNTTAPATVIAGTFRNLLHQLCHLLWYQLLQSRNPLAGQTMLIQVGQQWIEAFILGKDDALSLWRDFECAPEMKGNVKIQGVFAHALDLLKINAGKSMRCGIPARSLR